MDHEEEVREFYAAWGTSFEAMCAAFESTFSEDCRWDQRPLLLTTGIDPALGFLRRSRRLFGLETVDVDIQRLAAQGDVVICERIDHLRRRSGSLIASAPVTGVMEFKDGKLVYWREYYDSALFLKDAAMKGIDSLLGLLKRGAG